MPACTSSSTYTKVPADIHVQDSSAKNIINLSDYDFGRIPKQHISSETFTISYTGTTDLELTGTPKVVITGPNASRFTVTTQPTSPISPSNSTTFTIAFAPYFTGVKNATVSISNNDINENPFVFDVKGTGYKANYDFNGDGFPDVIVSATGDDDGGAASGSVFIFFGKHSWNSRILEAEADVKIIGEDISDGFGTSICSAGDVNNDDT